ncbi:WXG100-like domain-containing protein [Peterkaempfera griseoplana]|uniref:WXG100-like domain-containing protein n=1 Tax=Peterkaempfera griseoplana TaxID=66896 RepID=UPI0006E432EA|nr:hypothetical protein [Peterkaempfera griseoplana]
MIELPPDLAEVLSIVQHNEHGADIRWPDGDEDAISDLAAAWRRWNLTAAEQTRTILDSAVRARQNMSGDAADQYEEYLRKYGMRDDSHLTTTLTAGLTVEKSLTNASRTATRTKTEMVRELQYAKDYIATHPQGKHDDVAQSRGIKQAADTYHTYVGEVADNVDTMLRQASTHLDRMSQSSQAATLHSHGDSTSAGATSYLTPSTRVDGVASPMLQGTPMDADGYGTAEPFQTPEDPDAYDPAAAGYSAFGSGDSSAFGSGGYAPDGYSADGSGAGYEAAGAGGSYSGAADGGEYSGSGYGGSGYGGSGGSGYDASGYNVPSPGSVGGLQPFETPTGTYSGTGTGYGGGPYDSSGGGSPFDLSSTSPRLQIAGLGDVGSTTTGYPSAGGSGLVPWSPSTGSGGTPFDLTGSTGGGSGLGALGSSLGGFGGGAGSAFGGGSGGFGGGGGFSGSGLRTGGSVGSPGLASARAGAGMAGMAQEGAAAGRGTGSLGGRTATSATGSAAGRSGTAAAGAGATGTRPGGLGGGGGGKGEKRGARKYIRPTTLGEDVLDDDEQLLTDRGVTGTATRVPAGDRELHRMRRRWLDAARTDAAEHDTGGPHAPGHEAPAGASDPATEEGSGEDLLMRQLRTAVLGPDPESGADGEARTEGAAPAAAHREHAAGAQASAEAGTGAPEDDHLARSRSVAARRGHPDDPGGGASAEQRPEPGAPRQLRQEGGYTVPSPFLRTALSRMAASGALDNAGAPAPAPAPAGQGTGSQQR